MAFNFFNSEKILRLTPITQDSVDIADKMMSGDVKIFPKLTNVKVDNLDELWEMTFTSAPSTYSVYLYALYPVSYLLNAYEITDDTNYLDKALELAISFISWESSEVKKVNAKRLKILFGDHAVSNRTQSLCYLVACLTYANRDIHLHITEALLKNGKYLADINNYSHYNHGLMMDLALVGLLNTFEGVLIQYPSIFKENLLERLNHSLTRDLTEDGVHIENSPGYHFWMLNFLNRIASSLKYLDRSLYNKAGGLLGKASEYASYITRPDGSVPTIGDTHAGLKYKPSQGLKSRFFQHSNQVIFRSENDDIWAHFSSGYKTHVHKHCDNGSFNLYYKGQDILIDPGFLNYENDNDSRMLKGSSFHNTVKVKNKEPFLVSVDLSNIPTTYEKNLNSSKITEFQIMKSAEFSTALICDYLGFSIKRTVVWIKPNSFLIIDHCDEKVTLEQVFHISSELSVEVFDGGVLICNGNRSLGCKISQFDILGFQDLLKATNVCEAFYAKDFNLKGESKTVVFESKDGYFLTLINLLGDDPNNWQNLNCSLNEEIDDSELLKFVFSNLEGF